MPLQLRRGTDAQRQSMTEPLAAGELIYVTDTGTIYVGNGTTLGGVPVINLTAADIKPLAAQVFTGGSHTGISFTYNTGSQTIDAVVDPDLSNYDGIIRATAFVGSVFPDDSSLGGAALVDGIDGSINLNGTVKGNIIPNQDAVYDIGSPSAKFGDLYLSGSSLYLGDAVITSTGTSVNLPLGSTVGGVVIGSGDGVVAGSNYNINIVGDSSTLIVDSSAGVVNADTFGYHTGDVKGSVFADNSTLLVDGISGTLVGPINSSLLNVEGLNCSLSVTSAGVVVKTTLGAFLEIEGESSTSETNAQISIKGTRYSGSDYAAVQSGDDIGTLSFEAYNGTEFKKSATILSEISSVIGSGNFDTELTVSVLNASGLYKQFVFQSDHIFNSGAAVKVLPLADAVIGSISVDEGTIGYGSDRKSITFYDGSSFLTVPSFVSVPGGPTASGKQGQISADANYMYICYSDGNWIRIAKDGTW